MQVFNGLPAFSMFSFVERTDGGRVCAKFPLYHDLRYLSIGNLDKKLLAFVLKFILDF